MRATAIALVLVAASFGLGGCAVDRPDDVPASAMRMSAGDGQLTFRATQDGMVYIYDVDNHHMVYSGKLQRGEAIELRPAEDRVLIDGRVVSEKGIHRGNDHQIYFERISRYD